MNCHGTPLDCLAARDVKGLSWLHEAVVKLPLSAAWLY